KCELQELAAQNAADNGMRHGVSTFWLEWIGGRDVTATYRRRKRGPQMPINDRASYPRYRVRHEPLRLPPAPAPSCFGRTCGGWPRPPYLPRRDRVPCGRGGD